MRMSDPLTLVIFATAKNFPAITVSGSYTLHTSKTFDNGLYLTPCYILSMLVLLLPTHTVISIFPKLLLSIFILQVSAHLSPLIVSLTTISIKAGTMAMFTHCLILGTKPGIQLIVFELPVNYIYLIIFCLNFLKFIFNFL